MTEREAMLSYISYNLEGELVEYVKCLRSIAEEKPDRYIQDPTDIEDRFLWSMLVEMFGDCGTSPRFGWIYPENLHAAIDWLVQVYYEIEDKEGRKALGDEII